MSGLSAEVIRLSDPSIVQPHRTKNVTECISEISRFALGSNSDHEEESAVSQLGCD